MLATLKCALGMVWGAFRRFEVGWRFSETHQIITRGPPLRADSAQTWQPREESRPEPRTQSACVVFRAASIPD
eukprot:2186992-Pyramimonas_sp.AAC.1